MEQRHVSIKQLLSKPKRPIPQKDSKHANKQKIKQLKVKKKFSAGVSPILSIFENTETQKYRINSICGEKTTKQKNNVKAGFFPTNAVDAVFLCFRIFENTKNWRYPR